MNKKVQISQDQLYKFWTGHDLKLVRLAELTGLSEASINVCFKHYLGTNGKPRVFTPQAIAKINAALPVIADEIRGCVMDFEPGKLPANQRGKVYNPTLVEPMKKIGDYINITAMTYKLLKWSQNKKECVLVTKSSKIYGNITEEEVTIVNNELLSVSGMLSGYEVTVSDSSNSADSASSE